MKEDEFLEPLCQIWLLKQTAVPICPRQLWILSSYPTILPSQNFPNRCEPGITCVGPFSGDNTSVK